MATPTASSTSPVHPDQPPRPEDTIKAFARDTLGAAACGIASAAVLDELAPVGYRPSDILAGARSVVVIGGPLYTRGAWRTPDTRIAWANQLWAGRALAMRLARHIEYRHGQYAVFYDGDKRSGNVPFLDLELCAEQAGLGSRGLNGRILHPEHGLLGFSAAVTAMPLQPDGPLAEPVCPHPVCVDLWQAQGTTPCLSTCPTHLAGALDGRRIEWLEARPHMTDAVSETSARQAFQRMLIDILTEPDARQRKMMALGSAFTKVVNSVAYSSELEDRCLECSAVCPVVLQATTLAPRA